MLDLLKLQCFQWLCSWSVTNFITFKLQNTSNSLIRLYRDEKLMKMQEVRVKRKYKCQQSLQVSGHQMARLSKPETVW